MDFTLPSGTDLYTDVLTYLKSRDVEAVKFEHASNTNLPTGALRYNRTNRVLEEWSGSAWVEKRVEQPGIIKQYCGASAPRGHLLCDGSAVSRATYSDLWAIIGTAFGSGDGSTTFNLPDFRERFPLGYKSGSSVSGTLGGTGGSINHTHSVPAHYHSMGTGATLNVTSSGGHTTTIEIAHGHSATADINTTGVSATTGISTVSILDPGHAHAVPTRANVTAFDAGSGKYAIHEGNLAFAGTYLTVSASNTTGISLTNGSHSHTVSVTDTGHSHTINVTSLGTTNKTDTNGAHTHGSSAFAGAIGLVTGGVDGNASMTSGQANPPFQVVNYIISY